MCGWDVDMVGILGCISHLLLDLGSHFPHSFKYVGYWGISQEEEEPNESEKSTTLLVSLIITFLCIFTIKEQKHNENEKDKI